MIKCKRIGGIVNALTNNSDSMQMWISTSISAIDEGRLKCCEVQPSLATAALNDLFKAFRNPDHGKSFLPKALQSVSELRSLAIERAFVENAWDFGQKIASIPEDFVDMESNLKPMVLRKNLFRLGLPHDLFDKIENSIHRLLNYRNTVAHGSRLTGFDESEYSDLEQAVVQIMDELRETIIAAIANQSFRLKPSADPVIGTTTSTP